jgi:hypothetical protein
MLVEYFATEDVYIIVPDQPNLTNLKIHNLTRKTIADMPRNADFDPKLIKINFEVRSGNTVITRFYSPMVIMVGHKEDEKYTKLAYWKEKDSQGDWHVFKKFKKVKKAQGGGYGVAIISDWGDPNVGWGD